MLLKKLIAQFASVNRELYSRAKNPLKSHGPDHHERVCAHALALAQLVENERKITVDKEVLVAAAFLHDLAAFYPEKTGDRYHEQDHLLAKRILSQMKFPRQKIPAVLEAIKNHGSDQKYRSQKEMIAVTILRDADKIEAFGPLGVARIIMVRTLKGDTLKDIVDEFYTRGHLKRKWQSVTLKATRSMCEKDYQFSRSFFMRLSKYFRN